MDAAVGPDNPSAWERVAVADCRPFAEWLAARSAMDFEDAVQIALIACVRACRVWARSHADAPPAPYLKRAMKNELKDKRRRARARPDLLTMGIDAPDPPVPPPQRAAEAREVLAMLAEAGVDVALLTAWHDGVPTADIAAGLSLAPGTVRNRLVRERQRARDILRALALI